jgi:hypothetical protein
MPDTQPVTMLLVEDDPGHARLIERNLRRAHITNELLRLSEGQAAVDYLCGEGLRRPLPPEVPTREHATQTTLCCLVDGDRVWVADLRGSAVSAGWLGGIR